MNSEQGLFDSIIDGIGQVLNAIGPIDGACLVLVAFFAIKGFSKGLLRQVALLGTLVIGFTLSRIFAKDVAAWIPRLYSKVPDAAYHVYIAYFLIFLATFLVLGFAVRLLRRTLEALEIQSFDRFLGFVAGGLVGALLSSVALTAALMFTPRIGPGEKIHELIHASRSLRLVAHAVPRLRWVLPEEFVQRGNAILEHQDEGERREVPAPPATAPAGGGPSESGPERASKPAG